MIDIQAVLLCGGSGSRMTDLTEHMHKCLLTVAGVPMFWYPLNALAKSGIRDVKLITNEQYRAEYEKLLATKFYQWDHMKVEVLAVPREHDDWGTGDVLRHFHSKITGASTRKPIERQKDLLVVSGDFVGDVSLAPMIDLFRCRGAALCMLISDNCVNGSIPGTKSKRSKGRDLIAWSEETLHVAYCASEEDFEKAVAADAWVEKFKKVSLTARYNDCHVYLFRHWTMPILNRNKKFSSLKADFVPYLLEQQYNPKADDVPASSEENTIKPVNVDCIAYALPLENGTTVAHANNTGSYFEVNKAILKSFARLSPRLTLGKQFDFRATGVSAAESRVADTAKVSEKVVIKRSIVGENVLIGEKARVQGSVIMDNVEIGKGAHVTMSIVCPGARILDGAEVSNCIVTNNQTVHANAKVQNTVVEAESDDEDWQNE